MTKTVKNILRDYLISSVIAVVLALGALQIYDIYDRNRTLPSPIEFKQPTYTNGEFIEPGDYINIMIPSKRTRVCRGEVERIWRTPDNEPLGSEYIPISTFVVADDKWHMFPIRIKIPPAIKVPVVELEQRVYSRCDGRDTEPAIVPAIRIQLAQNG